MSEKPIIFKSEMVRAILDGRKTQTRGAVVPHKWVQEECVTSGGDPHWMVDKRGEKFFLTEWSRDEGHSHLIKCPYGAPGNLLWVRETWAVHKSHDNKKSFDLPKNNIIVYRADGVTYLNQGKWRPSVHMPRWASRITLRVTDVRVERVQDIGIYDISAEGLDIDGLIAGFDIESDYAPGDNPDEFVDAARDEFAELWDSINAKRGYGWNANPWVWVVKFEVMK